MHWPFYLFELDDEFDDIPLAQSDLRLSLLSRLQTCEELVDREIHRDWVPISVPST